MKKLVLILIAFWLYGCSKPNTNKVMLNEMDLSMIQQDMGNAAKDKTPMGSPIVIGGETFENGVGIMVPATILIELNENGGVFNGTVGLCEMRFPGGGPELGDRPNEEKPPAEGLSPGPEPGPGGPMPGGPGIGGPNGNQATQFYVLGDKKVLWESGEMGRNDKPKNVEIPLQGISRLALVAVSSGRFGGFAAWANTSISYNGDNAPKIIPNYKVNESTPVILTPEVSKAPKINYPKIVGATPRKPFIFSIPVTGEQPLQITVEGLPSGLHLDGNTGIISGITPDKKETFELKVKAKNEFGESNDMIKLQIGDLLALTPPMGWNSWNAGGMSVDQEKVTAAVDIISEKLRGHGWSYVNIDDGWQAAERNSDGLLLTNEKFPNIKEIGDYVHSKGFKFGIYSSPGPQTCGQSLGSYMHEYQDAETWASWGVDYLKYDWCSYGRIAKDNSLAELQKPYQLMKDAMDKTGRDVVYSLCQYGMGDVSSWGADVGGNLWRTTMDITDTWKSVMQTGFTQTDNYEFVNPGHWNDPDMLVIGNVGWSEKTEPTALSPDEQYAHISLWSLLSAPLLIGCEMEKLDDFTLGLVTNDEVIGVNQDMLGKQAQLIIKGNDYQIWAKDLYDGSKAIGIFYVGEDDDLDDPIKMIYWGGEETSSSKTFHLSFNDLSLNGRFTVRDLWRQQDIGVFDSEFNANVNYHGVALIKLTAV